jgi:hypothetical protein
MVLLTFFFLLLGVRSTRLFVFGMIELMIEIAFLFMVFLYPILKVL